MIRNLKILTEVLLLALFCLLLNSSTPVLSQSVCQSSVTNPRSTGLVSAPSVTGIFSNNVPGYGGICAISDRIAFPIPSFDQLKHDYYDQLRISSFSTNSTTRTNLLTNPGFEQNVNNLPTSWSSSATGVFSGTHEAVANGCWSLKASNAAASEATLTQSISVQPTQSYDLVASINKLSGLAYVDVSGTGIADGSCRVNSTQTGWQTGSCNFTAASNTTAVTIRVGVGANSTAYFDEVILATAGGDRAFTGKKFPPYTPATSRNVALSDFSSTEAGAVETDSIYYFNRSLDISATSGIATIPAVNPKTLIVFINGDLNIRSNFAYGNNQSGVVFVVSGNVNIEKTVSNVDGIFIVGGAFCSASENGSCSTSNTPLTINGAILSISETLSPKFIRTLANNDNPAETVVFQPKYYAILRNIFSSTDNIFAEINDSALTPRPPDASLTNPTQTPAGSFSQATAGLPTSTASSCPADGCSDPSGGTNVAYTSGASCSSNDANCPISTTSPRCNTNGGCSGGAAITYHDGLSCSAQSCTITSTAASCPAGCSPASSNTGTYHLDGACTSLACSHNYLSPTSCPGDGCNADNTQARYTSTASCTQNDSLCTITDTSNSCGDGCSGVTRKTYHTTASCGLTNCNLTSTQSSCPAGCTSASQNPGTYHDGTSCTTIACSHNYLSATSCPVGGCTTIEGSQTGGVQAKYTSASACSANDASCTITSTLTSCGDGCNGVGGRKYYHPDNSCGSVACPITASAVCSTACFPSGTTPNPANYHTADSCTLLSCPNNYQTTTSCPSDGCSGTTQATYTSANSCTSNNASCSITSTLSSCGDGCDGVGGRKYYHAAGTCAQTLCPITASAVCSTACFPSGTTPNPANYHDANSCTLVACSNNYQATTACASADGCSSPAGGTQLTYAPLNTCSPTTANCTLTDTSARCGDGCSGTTQITYHNASSCGAIGCNITSTQTSCPSTCSANNGTYHLAGSCTQYSCSNNYQATTACASADGCSSPAGGTQLTYAPLNTCSPTTASCTLTDTSARCGDGCSGTTQITYHNASSCGAVGCSITSTSSACSPSCVPSNTDPGVYHAANSCTQLACSHNYLATTSCSTGGCTTVEGSVNGGAQASYISANSCSSTSCTITDTSSNQCGISCTTNPNWYHPANSCGSVRCPTNNPGNYTCSTTCNSDRVDGVANGSCGTKTCYGKVNCTTGKNIDGTCTVGSIINLSTQSCSGRATPDAVSTYLTAAASAGSDQITVASNSGLNNGDEIWIMRMVYSSSPATIINETHTVYSTGTTITLERPLDNSYPANQTQVIRIPNYSDVNVNAGTITINGWGGSRGGVLLVRATGTVTIAAGASINLSGKGYRGGGSNTAGESLAGLPSFSPIYCRNNYSGGGGSTNGGPGASICTSGGGAGPFANGGGGVGLAGVAPNIDLVMGGGGGGATGVGYGGNGGGVLLLYANVINNSGNIFVNGGIGHDNSGACCSNWNSGAGGGGGGYVYLSAVTSLTRGSVSFSGGGGGSGENTCGGGDSGQEWMYCGGGNWGWGDGANTGSTGGAGYLRP